MLNRSLRRKPRFKPTRIRRRSHRVVGLGVLIALVLPAGAAYAFWSAGGTGGGGSKAITAQPLVVSAGTLVADLFPGNFGAIAFSVNNPNPYPVNVTSASGVTIGSITNVLGGGTCTASDFSLAAGTISGGAIPANSSATVTLNNALKMLTSATDGCQGVNVAITATLNGIQT